MGEVRETPVLHALARVAADVVTLIRPAPVGAAAVQVAVGADMEPGRSGTASVLAAAVAIGLVVAVANVVNDVKDQAADAVNRADRPLASGRLQVSAAWVLAGTCGAGALLCSWAQPGGPWLIAALLVLSVGYSYFLKSTVLWGNVFVACLAGTPILYGGFIGTVSWERCGLGSLLVILFMTAYEVLKTVRDRIADSSTGYVTISTRLGQAATVRVFRTLVGVYAAAAIGLPVAAHASPLYYVIMVPGSVAPVLVAAASLPLARSLATVTTMLKIMVLAWLPGLVALWLAFR